MPTLSAPKPAAPGTANRRLVALLGAVLAAVAVTAVAIAISGSSPSRSNAASDGRLVGASFSHRLFTGIPQHGTLLGSPRAPVRLVEFADLQCPYCDAYALQTLPTLVQRYVRAGALSMRFENLAFIGPDSVRAGRVAAAAAQQNRLWNFVDLLYLNQGEENSGYVTTGYIHRLLAAVPGLDAPRAERQSRSNAAAEALVRATETANRWGINATPSFLVGTAGGRLRVFQPNSLTPAPFLSTIGSLLKQAR